MDALAVYGSESDGEQRMPASAVSAGEAPVSSDDSDGGDSDAYAEDALRADAFGIAHADAADGLSAVDSAVTTVAASLPPGVKKTHSGFVEETHMSHFDFNNQQKTFDLLGYARNPSDCASGAYAAGSHAWVGDRQKAQQMAGATAGELRGGDPGARARGRALKKRRRGHAGDAGVVEGEGAYVGPWGTWEEERTEPELDGPLGPTAEEVRGAETAAASRQRDAAELERRRQIDEALGTEKSIFHGKSMYDYQGRTYMHVPQDTDVNLHGEPGSVENYIPQTCIHTWTGHTKGITALRLFPSSGHLLLSASLDGKIKLWDIYREGNCLRTFLGHAKSVRDIAFCNDGRRFLSAGYDGQIKLWDTETGACLRAFQLEDIPFCVRFHPDDDKQHIFLTGTSNNKILQYDVDTGEITQQYEQHLGAVNTITFVDENRRFVSTSDDKSLRAWDYDIPVVIKYVADPQLHSMPAVGLHPTKKWLACQSLDSQILVFNAESFKQARRKVFRGHHVGGFACEVAFSPDGRFISSGDRHGSVVFWDWKSAKLLTRLEGHRNVVMSHAWLPHESSKMVTGSWDGLIKLWT
ncbi:hypothetical protein MSPP1_000306 [Malassezia sp. CBS 17886]|nr:hypothetical protein MSPP1_000306 [Malassezia sp. CBS 17886]